MTYTEDTKFISMLQRIKDKNFTKNKSINDLYHRYLKSLESQFPYQAFNIDFNQKANKTPFDVRAFAQDINLTIKEERLDINILGKLENNIITVNSIDTYFRQKFIIARQIGHYLLAHGDIIEYRRNESFYNKDQLQKEEDTDCFASNLLLPASIISKVVSLFKKQLKIQKLSDNIYSTKLQLVGKLKYVLDVSEHAVIKRLKALNYLESYIWL